MSSSFRDFMRRKRACSRRLARHAVCSFEMSTSSYCCASQSHMLPDLHALVCSKVQCSLASRFNNGQTWKLATCNRVQGQASSFRGFAKPAFRGFRDFSRTTAHSRWTTQIPTIPMSTEAHDFSSISRYLTALFLCPTLCWW